MLSNRQILKLVSQMKTICEHIETSTRKKIAQEETARLSKLAGIEQRIDEKWGVATKVSQSEKGKYAGKTKAELLKSYNALKKSGPHKKGSEEYGRMRELAFAIRAKGEWGKVGED